MFQKVFEYAGPHKKGLYVATAIVLVSVLLGVFPFVLAYQVIAPLVMGEAITASFIIQHVILVLVCLVLQALFYGWGLNLSHKAAYDYRPASHLLPEIGPYNSTYSFVWHPPGK